MHEQIDKLIREQDTFDIIERNFRVNHAASQQIFLNLKMGVNFHELDALCIHALCFTPMYYDQS